MKCSFSLLNDDGEEVEWLPKLLSAYDQGRRWVNTQWVEGWLGNDQCSYFFCQILDDDRRELLPDFWSCLIRDNTRSLQCSCKSSSFWSSLNGRVLITLTQRRAIGLFP
ncbi:hypothetical protein AVEN_46051-1 [Araneus ventricosus]|uniref:Uncharacterized protein n=1 Tax=Araneus ventricosus TaxID=182803 RepID=A0A4Y2NIX2_ARAVE|nr:hypothetical protein AVEN_46051-1 [Araneus ventricosus]